MRVLVHLSDLHFGRVDYEVLAPLRRCVEGLHPHLVVVSGDLTQRARREQFREARAFLDTLPRPQIVVPGNHDVPLYNVFRRFVNPLKQYRSLITDDLEPQFIDDQIAVVGVNTARSLTFKGGRISEAQVEAIRTRLCELDEHLTKIVVTHHPFDLPEHWEQSQVVRRAAAAMSMFSRCGADILLAGHLHMSHAGATAARSELEGYSALLVQAGTATSVRGRGENNSFNVLRIVRREVRVERYTWDPAIQDFSIHTTEVFRRGARGWQPFGAAAQDNVHVISASSRSAV
jgi:3',5'-cyclic AMP phosphodiesterase CpdA